MKKFELTTEQKINWFGRTLYRIKACISFTTTSGDEVKAGDPGGFVEKESNLSHDGKAWVYGNAEVWGNAEVYGNAEVCGDAEVCGNAKVWGNAEVYGDAKVRGNAEVWGNAEVYGDAKVYGNAAVCGDASVFSTEHIFCVTPIGEYANSLTLFRTKHLEIKISFELDVYTVDQFLKVIDGWCDDKQKSVAIAAIELAYKHIDLTPTSDDLKPCPFCGGEAEYNADSDVVVCTNCCASADKKIWNKRV